ncbi:hypothetical protein SDC9_160877 [bioreactor metagenome]|uniref:Uncharacterized protein n=1 Tax=bioreactor metagenome TaxID=1076179 RepID=A0A645FIT8_9ZZZZ
MAVFADEFQALVDAEPVLFIGDHQSQIGKGHILFQNRVSSDDHHGAAGRDGFLDFLLFPGFERSDQVAHLNAEGFQHGQEVRVVLGRQYFSRYHQCALIAVFHHIEQPGQCHNGLARADIALQQAVHRGRRGHIRNRFGNRTPLGTGERKREQRLKLAAVIGTHHGAGRCFVPPA